MAKPRRGRGEGRVEKLPSGSYRVVVSLGKGLDGKRVRESITDPTKAGALAAARARLSEAGASGPAADRSLTAGAWAARWLAESRSHLSAGTFAVRTRRVAKHVSATRLAGVPLSRVRPGDVRSWLEELESAGTPPSERAEALKLLRMLLNEAVRRELIPSSAAHKVRPPKVVRKDKRSLTAVQALALVAAGAAEGLNLYLVLALDSGCRPGELLALRRSDLLADGRTLDVRRSVEIETGEEKATKTRAGRRRVLLSRHAASLLSPGADPDARLIARPGERWDYHTWLLPRFRRAAKLAGVPWATPYTPRHTMATVLLSAGVPITAVAARLGHANPAVTLQHYAHSLPTDQERAADAADAAIWGRHTPGTRPPDADAARRTGCSPCGVAEPAS